MKADMNKLKKPEEKADIYDRLAKKIMCFAVCLGLLGVFTITKSLLHSDSASADVLYDTSLTNPSFTVQHVGDVTTIDIGQGDGPVTVLTKEDTRHAQLNEDGTFRMVTNRIPLYKDYQTDWLTTDSITGMSFLNGEDGSQTAGYRLKEIWFGKDPASQNQSDFLVLSVPATEGKTDLSRVTLTNNPEHPNLSEAEGGYYKTDESGNYTVCITDGDVIRLVFDKEESLDYKNVDVFDYDISDGGYYLEEDYLNKGEKYPTSGQGKEKGPVYAETKESGIHSFNNYIENGARFAFGGSSVGTGLGDEYLNDELNTINIWNYGQQKSTADTGVTRDLTSGVDKQGNIRWTDGVSGLNLFGHGDAAGRTDYTDGEYSFTFKRDGFTRTLSAVESAYGTVAEGLEALSDADGNLTNRFFILDGAPSAGTDGHDPIWGDGSENIRYYNGDDGISETFPVSDDGENHNSFFGFAHTEDFVLSPGYTGAFEFFGYSDDDMWVYAGQIDENGQVMPDTVVQVADLGGVHDGAAFYCDMWNVIDKVEYGQEPENWRLFIYWLDRDGISADCYMNFTLPEAAMKTSEKVTGSLLVEAGNYQSIEGITRTFLFDDGTGNRYQGTYDDGTDVTIVSGEEFTIPNGSLICIKGLTDQSQYTLKETGKTNVWFSTGDGYVEGDTITSTVGANIRTTFISTMNAGTISIGVDGDGTPEGGYVLKLTLKDVGETEVSAMDSFNNPMGSAFTDKDGQMIITLAAGETQTLYNLPDGAKFTLEPVSSPGWHVSEILLDDAEASESVVFGQFPAYVVYRYEKNEVVTPQIIMEQSVSGDWGTSDITALKGSLISYKITVTNSNEIPVDVCVSDDIPEGISVMETSLPDGGELNENELTWNLTLDPGSVKELYFTGQVTAEEACEIANKAWIMIGEEAVCDSNTVKIIIP